jgi:hypothetical protein
MKQKEQIMRHTSGPRPGCIGDGSAHLLTGALIAGILILAAPAQAQLVGWVERTPEESPSARSDVALAYDSVRRETILFSGWPYAASDTWTWDGHTWKLAAETGPDPRYGHRMVFDEAREEVVLFGGISCYTCFYGDTWTWDGTEWTLVSTGGPSPRHRHAMAYDSLRDVVVLHGGVTEAGHSQETWEWDGTDWELRASKNTPPYGPGAMAFDEARGVSVYFKGDETWEWDGSSWTLREVNSPTGRRVHHAMVYSRVQRAVILFGGFGAYPWGVFGDTWKYDGKQWTFLTDDGPRARFTHGMAYHASRKTIVMFGGRFGTGYDIFGDTWEFLALSPGGRAH